MKTIRLFIETENLAKEGTKILVSSENRMEDKDIEEILDDGFEQESDDLITLKINTVQEDTGRETMDLVVLYGVLKSRLTGDVQAALFSKLGEFYKEGFPKLKTEAESWGAALNDKIISSSTIDEYEKQIQFLVPDDYDDSDLDEDGDEEEEEAAAGDSAEAIEQDSKKANIFAIVACVIVAFGLFLGYQMLKPEEKAIAKEKDKQVSQQKNNSSSSSNTNNNAKSNSKNNKKPKKNAPAEEASSDGIELNSEEVADSKGGSSGGSSSDGSSNGSGSGKGSGSSESGVSLDTAMSDLSNSQKSAVAVAFGLPQDGSKQNPSAITKKRQGLKNIGEAIESFSSPKRFQNFVACWKKFYPNDRLDFDLYLLERAYSGSPYKLESTDWSKPAFGQADVAVIREIDRLFSGSASDFASYINAKDSEELALLNDINSVKSLSDLGEVFKKQKCAELFASRMTLENLKASIEYNLKPSNNGNKISDEIYAKFSDFRNKKENVNLNNKQLMDAFLNDMLREAQKESASVALVHRDFNRIVEAIKAAAD